MANWKSRKQFKSRPSPKQNQPAPTLPSLSPQKRVVTFARAIYALVFALVSWVSAVTAFVPKLDIYQTQTFDPPTPFSVRFEIQNNGFFDVHDVHISARANGRLGGIVFGKGGKKDSEFGKMLELMVKRHPEIYGHDADLIPGMEPSFISKIEPGQKPATWMNMTLVNIETKEGDSIDAVLSVSFRPSFAWWHKVVNRRFITIRSQDGSFGRVEAPLEDRP